MAYIVKIGVTCHVLVTVLTTYAVSDYVLAMAALNANDITDSVLQALTLLAMLRDKENTVMNYLTLSRDSIICHRVTVTVRDNLMPSSSFPVTQTND